MKKQDNQKTGKFKIRSFAGLIRQTKPQYWQLLVGLTLGLIATLGQLVVPKFAQLLVNEFSKGLNGTLLAIIIALFILSAVISAISGTFLGAFGEQVVAKLRQILWEKLINLKITYFDNVKVGQMTSRLVNDSDQIKDLLSNFFPNAVTAIFQLVGAFFFMLVMDWRMTLIMFIVVPGVFIMMRPIMRQTMKVGHARQETLADFNGQVDDTLSEIRLVKASNAEQYEVTTGHQSINHLYQIGLKEAIYNSIAGPLMGTTMMALMVGLLAYGAHRVATGTMTMGTLFAFLMYLFQVISPVSILGQFSVRVAKASGATEHIQELLAETEEDFSQPTIPVVANQPLNLEHVDFSYQTGQPILTDINITAKPNTTVAFVGPSGSGKSTILNLIERYYQPTAGAIKIGTQDIHDLNLKSWRQQLGFVSQDSAIMAGTIRHNLTYGLAGDYSDDEIWHVLKLAYADEFVRQMDQQLDTQVGERGVKVSGGQRQRLAIARAFLRNPQILMLDEATASLDSESEAMVQKALNQLMAGRTTLIIAHRLSTIVDANEIYFIDDGQVSGHGTHQELMQSLPKYQEYVKIQFK
ncbi:Lipid A export ATP-binding, permease protein MsbA [Fructilactobacillus florum 8D]|uniref:Multidrug resistance ABC transporter ATP-binding and permease protein n=1 Tax=Fructilactobacillus florum 8D TaxID=1221538 RepID=W9EHQ1_9LACO|nr:Lipid A export ATP-binding, permease protein MsbA [Fructilactobacillus florum 2F]ETO40786.1 Lipid A export ATP-binding, permease protein MsbA [Fructilactobacillus florum 8D]